MPWDRPRDPARIEPTLAELRRIWERYPDMRLGQLVVNGARRVDRDPFNVEDDLLLHGLRQVGTGQPRQD